MIRFGKRGKLSPRYIRPFEVLERVGIVAYRLALPPSLSMFTTYSMSACSGNTLPDPTHVVDWGELVIDTYGTFDEGPVRIRDSRDQDLQRKTMRLVKVLWRH